MNGTIDVAGMYLVTADAGCEWSLANVSATAFASCAARRDRPSIHSNTSIRPKNDPDLSGTLPMYFGATSHLPTAFHSRSRLDALTRAAPRAIADGRSA